MNFHDLLQGYPAAALDEALASAGPNDVLRAIQGRAGDERGLIALLSPAAATLLEPMAQKAHEISVRQFGRVVQLFTPLYVSNHCSNGCIYCGFNTKNRIERKKLSLDEVEREAVAIAATGLKHILLLTGEAPNLAGMDYLVECCRILRRHFSSVAIEIYPLTSEEYARLIAEGVDALTLFQETYNPELYKDLHPYGPKRDYGFRLDAPERACHQGIRSVNLGALLGLDGWRRDSFFTALHTSYLQDKYPATELSISLPRMRPHTGDYEPAHPVSDSELVQIMLALRIFLPRCGITISTREAPGFRDRIIPLGVTRMSAGVCTTVGGHADEAETKGQFEIADQRSVAEMAQALETRGYQAVYQDWMQINHLEAAS